MQRFFSRPIHCQNVLGAKRGFEPSKLAFLPKSCLSRWGFLISAAEPLQREGLSEALSVVFGYVPRIVAGSFMAYLISQLFDVWFFHRVREMTQGRLLWLRNIVSTTISQGIDTFVFLMIAFYGVLPNFWEFMLTTWLIKVAIAVLDTPCVYAAKAAANRAGGR